MESGKAEKTSTRKNKVRKEETEEKRGHKRQSEVDANYGTKGQDYKTEQTTVQEKMKEAGEKDITAVIAK
eukprot:14014950-Ditylum_brightwellii.AAC.1